MYESYAVAIIEVQKKIVASLTKEKKDYDWKVLFSLVERIRKKLMNWLNSPFFFFFFYS